VDWIKLPVRIRDDPRVTMLAEKLDVPFHAALGMVVHVLTWCAAHDTRCLPASMDGRSRQAFRDVGLAGPEGLSDFGEIVTARAGAKDYERDRKAAYRLRRRKLLTGHIDVPGTPGHVPELSQDCPGQTGNRLRKSLEISVDVPGTCPGTGLGHVPDTSQESSSPSLPSLSFPLLPPHTPLITPLTLSPGTPPLSMVVAGKRGKKVNGEPPYSRLFARWWKNYPRKVGKDDAWKAWQRAVRREGVTEEAFEQAAGETLDWQMRSRKWRQDDGQFVPHPTTYLNRGSWKDERGDDD
jgi:hypothetical protein